MSSAAAEAATRYQRTFHGRTDQVARIRREIASHLTGCPITDDAVLIASELAANAVTHSDSAGEFFTVRCDSHRDYIWIEVEDLGGPWELSQNEAAPTASHHRDPSRAGQLGNRDDGTATASYGPGWTCPIKRSAQIRLSLDLL